MAPSTASSAPVTVLAPGQVAATDQERIKDFPSDAQLAKTVHSLPLQVSGQLLGASANLLSAQDAGQVLRLFLKHSKQFMSRHGKLTVTQEPDGSAYAGGVHFTEHRGIVGKTTLLMQDKNDKPVALCLQDHIKFHGEYAILGVRPLSPNDAPKQQQDGIAFYPWFQVLDINDAIHGAFRSVSVWNGTVYEPLWRAYPATRRPGKKAANLCLVKKTEILVTLASNSQSLVGILNKTTRDDTLGWDMTIAPGIDPALFLCVVAVVEELN